jgi:hypothetical protein
VSLWSRRQTMVVWSSDRATYAGRPKRHVFTEVRCPRRIRWWLRTGALLAMIGLMRLGRTVRLHPRPAVSLAGTALTVIGISLPSQAVLISGFLVLLLALFMPSDPAEAPARSCAHGLCATPFMPRVRHLPPSN